MCFCPECGSALNPIDRQQGQPQPLVRPIAPAASVSSAATTRPIGSVIFPLGARRKVPAVLAAVPLVCFAGLAAFLLTRRGEQSATQPAQIAITPIVPIQRSTPREERPTAAPAASDAERNDVTATLQAWIGAVRGHDLDRHMSYYAPSLDIYHSARNVSSDRVRRDLARAFSRYAALKVQLADITVTVDSASGTAIATFTKSWDFSGNSNSVGPPGGKTWSGLVRETVWLRRTDGGWRIAGIRDH
jgi:ketosteroid isomerase-like protein